MSGQPIERVHIAMTDATEPVYHSFDHWECPDEAFRASQFHLGEHVMACGRRFRTGLYTACLRRDHADAFARPCRQCFGGDQ